MLREVEYRLELADAFRCEGPNSKRAQELVSAPGTAQAHRQAELYHEERQRRMCELAIAAHKEEHGLPQSASLRDLRSRCNAHGRKALEDGAPCR